jgi:hypothetical protein
MSDADVDILRRIERETGVSGLVELLASRLPPTDLQSLLLAVMRRRAAHLRPADVLRRYEQDRFVRPCPLSPRVLADVERLAHRALPASFELVALSPITPLGSVAAVTGVAQNSVISTTRSSEVVSDATNVLALECSLRRRALLADATTRHRRVELAAIHRVVRGQVWSEPGSSQHFSLLGLCTAGRDEGSFRFESDTLATHLRFHIRLLQEVAANGPGIRSISVRVTPTERARRGVIEKLVVVPLTAEFPDVAITLDDERDQALDYYTSACLAVSIETFDGREVGLADGGFTTWTQQLLGNRKERLMISGIGLERIADLLAG